jgi:hypothetical protein
MAKRLRKTMTEEEFENGYWYATELQEFANRVGFPPPRGFARTSSSEP